MKRSTAQLLVSVVEGVLANAEPAEGQTQEFSVRFASNDRPDPVTVSIHTVEDGGDLGPSFWYGTVEGYDEIVIPERPVDEPLYATIKGGVKFDGEREDWVREDFDPWSELTKERDGYRADAEAERHRQW